MRLGVSFSNTLSVAIGVTLASCGASAFGASFQLQEQSASGLGIAYAGMGAAAQDASTVFWNPAGMAVLRGGEITVAADYIAPRFEFSSAGPPPGGSTYDAFGNGGNGGVSALVPGLYASAPVTPRLSAGIAVNAPFGLTTEWKSPWAGMFIAVKSRIVTVNINPGVSWKVNDSFSLGAGVSYQRLEATLTNGLTPLVPAAQGRVDGNDWAWGWNVGALLNFGEGTRVGLTYRSSANYHVTGGLTFNAASAPLAPVLPPPSAVSADLKLPDVASLAIAQTLPSGVRLLADVSWTGWNSLQALTVIATSGPLAGHPVSNLDLGNTNSWRGGVGVEMPVNHAWLLRVGTAYDRSPIPDRLREPRLPDNDRTWLAVGARFQPGESWSCDVGYAHLWVKDGPSELPATGPVPGALIGTYRSDINIFGVQGSLHF